MLLLARCVPNIELNPIVVGIGKLDDFCALTGLICRLLHLLENVADKALHDRGLPHVGIAHYDHLFMDHYNYL